MMQFVPAKIEHITYLVDCMRKADRAECWASGLSPYECLLASLEASVEAWTAMEDDVPIAMWGLTTTTLVGAAVGCPWLLTGTQVERHKLLLVREARAWLRDRALMMYPHLANLVDARYTKSLKWLRRLGFTIHEPKPHGPLGMLFCVVELKDATP